MEYLLMSGNHYGIHVAKQIYYRRVRKDEGILCHIMSCFRKKEKIQITTDYHHQRKK